MMPITGQYSVLISVRFTRPVIETVSVIRSSAAGILIIVIFLVDLDGPADVAVAPYAA